MDSVDVAEWSVTRRKGFTRYVIRYTVLILLLIVGLNVFSAGIGAVTDKGDWHTFVQEVKLIKWLGTLVFALFIGSIAGMYSWYSKEKTYKSQQRR